MSLFELPFHWIRRAGPSPAFWLGGPLLLYSWTLIGPLRSDDLQLVLKSERYIRGESNRLDLYRFAATHEEWRELRNRGDIPWWSQEKGRVDFFRPIAERSFYLDVLLFGRRAFLFRLMSLAVFALALWCVHWMFIQAAVDPIRAGVATLFFGISQTATPPVTWMCNRHDLLVVIGASLAAGAYWAAGDRPRLRYLLIAVVACALALLSKELAVALPAIIVVNELMRLRKIGFRRGQSMQTAIAALLLVCLGCYLAFYLYQRPWVLDIGGGDSLPTQLGSNLPLSLLLYASVWTIGFPIDAIIFVEPIPRYLLATASGVLVAIACHYLRKTRRHDRALMFFSLWAILFILPGLRAFTLSSRTLCTATVGWAYLVAGIIVPTRPEDTVASLFYRQLMFAANGTVSIGCVIGTILLMNHVEQSAQSRIERAVAAMNSPLADGDSLVIQQADSILEILFAGDRLEFMTGRSGVCATYLLPPDVDAEVRRVDDRTLLMRSRGASLLGTPFHRVTRGSKWRPKIGDTFQLSHFKAEVTDADAAGSIRELRFTFPRGLDDRSLHFDPPAFSAIVQGGPALPARQDGT